jgi:hypothetical protein
MGASDSDQAAARRHLEVVQAGLRQLDTTAAMGQGNVSSTVVHGAVSAALSGLDGAVVLLSVAGDEPRVGCGHCGRMVMSAATLCGYCWRVLSPSHTPAS